MSDETTVDDGVGAEWKAEAVTKLAAIRAERTVDHVTAAVRELTRAALAESEVAVLALHCTPCDEAALDRAAIASVVLEALVVAGAAYVANGSEPVSVVTREILGEISGSAAPEVARQLQVLIAHKGERVALVKARMMTYEASQAAANWGAALENEKGINHPDSIAYQPIEFAAFEAFDDTCKALKQFDIKGA